MRLSSEDLRTWNLSHYRRLEKDLRRELDVQPELETQRLAKEILDGAVPVVAPPPQACRAARLPRQVPSASLPARLERLSAEVRAALAGTAKLTRALALQVCDALDAAAIECRQAAGQGVDHRVDDSVVIDPAYTPRVAVDHAAAA